ncbi:hypothetical protein NP493_543g01001 [Ridgeia piscesae]|uniref:Uncharacterized protein n=1 Tax=Ridgeia piscesae TaxID=27915 RepID=A0AAD9NT53_RIDPI|nr:hypothetical protein NP493_543g01001 [Ridgeia piscesae]
MSAMKTCSPYANESRQLVSQPDVHYTGGGVTLDMDFPFP